MPTGFLTLPREIRDKIYELCLLLEEPFHHPWNLFRLYFNEEEEKAEEEEEDFSGELSLALLRTNKAISYEARSILYQNRFTFTKANSEQVSSFFEKIGRSNAGCIRHIDIDFPSLLDLKLGSVTIYEPHARILASIQNYCTNLKTLTTSRSTTDIMEDGLIEINNPGVVAEALTLVNTHFRAISSLQDIIVKVYRTPLSDHIRKLFEDQGWTVDPNGYYSDLNSDSSVDEWDRTPTEWDEYNDFMDDLRNGGYLDDFPDDDSDSDL